MAPPRPLGRPTADVIDDAGRLWIVHDDEVVRIRVELARIQLLKAREALALLLGEPLRVALQRVVNRLRDGEELVRTADDAPLDLEARVLHERHERVLDLSDAASESGRRQLEHAGARKRLRERANLVHQAAGRDGRVIR